MGHERKDSSIPSKIINEEIRSIPWISIEESYDKNTLAGHMLVVKDDIESYYIVYRRRETFWKFYDSLHEPTTNDNSEKGFVDHFVSSPHTNAITGNNPVNTAEMFITATYIEKVQSHICPPFYSIYETINFIVLLLALGKKIRQAKPKQIYSSTYSNGMPFRYSTKVRPCRKLCDHHFHFMSRAQDTCPRSKSVQLDTPSAWNSTHSFVFHALIMLAQSYESVKTERSSSWIRWRHSTDSEKRRNQKLSPYYITCHLPSNIHLSVHQSSTQIISHILKECPPGITHYISNIQKVPSFYTLSTDKKEKVYWETMMIAIAAISDVINVLFLATFRETLAKTKYLTLVYHTELSQMCST